MKKLVRPHGSCRHCPRRETPLYARGLCYWCYYNPAVRHRYHGPRSVQRHRWTAKEVQAFREMRGRTPPLPLKLCAAHLGLTYAAVCNASHQYRVTVFVRDRSAKVEAFKRLYKGHGRTRTDAEIASIVGCSRMAIQRVRKSLGIPRQPNRGRRGAMTGCFSCPAKIPTCRVRLDGWQTRALPGYTGGRQVEVYCAKCFSKYGWPPVYGPA